MSEFCTLVLFIIGSLVSIFSPDIRSRIASISFKVSFPSEEKKNRRIKKRIELLEELSTSQTAMLAYFASQTFLTIIFLAVVIFFGFMMLLRVHALFSVIAFVIFWSWFLVVVGTPFDVAVQLRRPEETIKRLRSEIKRPDM